MSSSKTYVSYSNIPNSGLGLFAKTTIKKGAKIAEFKGILKSPDQDVADKRSNILFNDGWMLSCPETDRASFANDCICVPLERRKLMESLKSTTTPFYEMHRKSNLNASISLDDGNHRAFLVSNKNIKKGDEIFVHYGFVFWFTRELENGFLQEDDIDEHGFPETFHQYPAFLNYLKLVFPDYTKITAQVSDDGDESMVTVQLQDLSTRYFIPIPNYRRMVKRVEI
jgi:SET domain-containing protein